jgi:hypothetical protein
MPGANAGGDVRQIYVKAYIPKSKGRTSLNVYRVSHMWRGAQIRHYQILP